MEIKIALAGNPNAGKTTLFNVLTGSNQFVGNWPGVTVEKKEGKLKTDKDVIITDLPGIYSLSPYTTEEVVARNYLLNERPDAILNIVDGTNLERNLYLTTQLAELGIPVVCAINMMDVVEKNGDKIDFELLSKQLGCKVVEISALKETGIEEAAEIAIAVAKEKKKFKPKHKFCGCVEHAIAHIEEYALHDVPEDRQRWYAIKLFERDEKVYEMLEITEKQKQHIEMDIKEAEEEMDDDNESIIANERYVYITNITKECLVRKNKDGLTISDKIDRIVTNRILALPIFALVMFIVYYVSVTTVGGWLTDWTNDVFFGEWVIPAMRNLLESINCADWLTGLVVDGIIGGVGAVLGFLPQMLVLFMFLAFLEACGYMSRIAFVMDRIFHHFGLSGKSIIPMLVGTGCSVPGIMSSRTIENDRDRRITVITTSFIPCSAKIPIISLIAGALFGNSGLIAASAYLIGMVSVIISGVILKKFKAFSSEPTPFVMELPPYHMPTFKNILRSVWERGSEFVKKAGTVILISAVILWFLENFGFENGSFGMTENLEKSILAMLGGFIAPVFAPLGWGDWKAAVAMITGLIAKENIVATFGTLFHTTGDGNELWSVMGQYFTTLSGYSFLIFNLLCAPCFAAMGAIKREMNSPKWTAFAIAYQCVFAYAVSMMIYQIGLAFMGTPDIAGFIIATVVLIGFIFLLVRPPYKKENSKKSDN